MSACHRTSSWPSSSRTSLLVATPFSEEAAAISVDLPTLSVGLHADLPAAVLEEHGADAAASCAEELERQIERHCALTGRSPSHLDSHHNVHRRDDLVDAFVRAARRHRLPLRGHGEVTYVSAFYGRWGGRAHPEQIGVEGLERVLRASVGRVVELGCHPGHCDASLRSSYREEREVELRTLCDEGVPKMLEDLGFVLLGRPAPSADTVCDTR